MQIANYELFVLSSGRETVYLQTAWGWLWAACGWDSHSADLCEPLCKGLALASQGGRGRASENVGKQKRRGITRLRPTGGQQSKVLMATWSDVQCKQNHLIVRHTLCSGWSFSPSGVFWVVPCNEGHSSKASALLAPGHWLLYVEARFKEIYLDWSHFTSQL